MQTLRLKGLLAARQWAAMVQSLLSVCFVVSIAASAALPVWSQSLPPATPAKALDEEARQSLLWRHFDVLDNSLMIPPKYLVDEDLRAAVQAMVKAELPRMRSLVRSWLDEELARAPRDDPARVSMRVWGRLANEMALWQLDRDGPAHEHLLLQAFLQPRACEWTDSTTSYLTLLLQVWRQVPLAKRPDLLAFEANVLRRWGLPRALVGDPPQPSSFEVAVEAVSNLIAGRAEPSRAMSPELAWWLLSEKTLPQSAAGRHTRCMIDQWVLAMDMQQGGGTISELAARRHRFARMPTVDVWAPKRAEGRDDLDDYPFLAKLLEVEGSIQVEYRLNARGVLQSSRIVKREITAPGLGAQRPVAMEVILDEASLARVAAMKHPVPEPASLQQGLATKNITLAWKLR